MDDVGKVVQVRAPAKINLSLAVLGRLSDAYHEIESWVAKLDWYDEITIRPAAEFSLTIHGNPALPADERNLVVRAARLFADATGQPLQLAIELRKEIPMGAGLGGGSSDAAATLLGLNQFWALGWPGQELAALGGRLGADIPLFLCEAPQVIIRGRGEKIDLAPNPWKGWVAVVIPNFALGTGDVYKRWNPRGAQRPRSAPESLKPIRCRDIEDRLFNDLESAAFAVEPRLARLHKALHGLAGRSVRMTGSGSCLFAIFDKQAEALDWATMARDVPALEVGIIVTKTL